MKSIICTARGDLQALHLCPGLCKHHSTWTSPLNRSRPLRNQAERSVRLSIRNSASYMVPKIPERQLMMLLQNRLFFPPDTVHAATTRHWKGHSLYCTSSAPHSHLHDAETTKACVRNGLGMSRWSRTSQMHMCVLVLVAGAFTFTSCVKKVSPTSPTSRLTQPSKCM